MNEHLVRAKDYIGRGEEFYRKAAGEIVAARGSQFSLTWDKIAEAVGKSDSWCQALVTWSTNPQSTGTPFSEPQGQVAQRHAKAVLRKSSPEELRDLISDLPPERRAEVVRAAIPVPDVRPRERSEPTFIELIVRATTALIEIESLVGSWQSLTAVPREFSRDSFSDIVAKALRIQDKFDSLAAAIDDENEDEFAKIVRNFAVVGEDV